MSLIIRSPKFILAILLFIILLSSYIHTYSLQMSMHIISILIAVVAIDLLFVHIRRIKFFFPSAALVTGLIIILLSAPDLPIYDAVTACLFAMVSKNFIRIKGHHLFNPAGFGLFFAGVLFHHTISWWGVSFQTLHILSIVNIIVFIILLSPLIISLIRLKRYRITIPFLITNSIIISIFSLTHVQNIF